MSATVRSGFKEQTSRLQEIGKVIFKWTIQDFHKFQDIEGEIRSPTFEFQCGQRVEKFHLKIQCLELDKTRLVNRRALHTVLNNTPITLVKETDGDVCSKIRLDRTCQSLMGKKDLSKKENVILKPGSNEGIFWSSVRTASDSEIVMVLTLSLVQSNSQIPWNRINPVQDISGLTRLKEIGKINFKWTIEDYKAHQAFQTTVRSECLMVECDDAEHEIFHFELTVPPDDDYYNQHLTKLILVKKSEGEALVNIGMSTEDSYEQLKSISKSGRILKEGRNKDLFKDFSLLSHSGNNLTLHFEIVFCKSSFELID